MRITDLKTETRTDKMKTRSLLLTIVLMLSVAGVASAQNSIFMRVGGIVGPVTEARHQGWINVLAFGQSVAVDSTGLSTGGGGVPLVACSVQVVKGLDIAGPLLWQRAAEVDRTNQVDIEVVDPS